MNAIYAIGTVNLLTFECECGFYNTCYANSLAWDVSRNGRVATADIECKSCKKESIISCKPTFITPIEINKS
jgi:hypothetical protein